MVYWIGLFFNSNAGPGLDSGSKSKSSPNPTENSILDPNPIQIQKMDWIWIWIWSPVQDLVSILRSNFLRPTPPLTFLTHFAKKIKIFRNIEKHIKDTHNGHP